MSLNYFLFYSYWNNTIWNFKTGLKQHYHSSHLSNELQILCNANWSVQLSSTAEVTGKTCDCWSQQISGNVHQYDAQSQSLNMASLSVALLLLLFRCGRNSPSAVRENCSPVFSLSWCPLLHCKFMITWLWIWTRSCPTLSVLLELNPDWPETCWRVSQNILFPITLSDFIYRYT